MALHYIYGLGLGIILNYPDVWLNSATHHPGTSTAASTACRLPVRSLGVELNDCDRADERIAASHNSGSAVFWNDNRTRLWFERPNPLLPYSLRCNVPARSLWIPGYWSALIQYELIQDLGVCPNYPPIWWSLFFWTCILYSYYIQCYLIIYIYIYNYLIMIMFHYIVTYIYKCLYMYVYIN